MQKRLTRGQDEEIFQVRGGFLYYNTGTKLDDFHAESDEAYFRGICWDEIWLNIKLGKEA